MALFIWSYTNLCEEEKINVIFSNLNYWLLRNDTSYKNMNRPIVNVHFICMLGSCKFTHIMHCFIIAGNILFSLYSVPLDETCNLWSKHYDNCVALIVLLPKTQKRIYAEDSPFIKNWFCSNCYIQLSDSLCKMTPLKKCLPFRHWNNLALKFSHVIITYFALLVCFSFKRISCLKNWKVHDATDCLPVWYLLHIKILHNFPRSLFNFFQTYSDQMMFSVHEG